MTKIKHPSPKTQPLNEYILQTYGDMIFDFFHVLTQNTLISSELFQTWYRRASSKKIPFQKNERAFLFRLALQISETRRRAHPTEELERSSIDRFTIDADTHRVKYFDYFFKNLKTEERALLFLKDKMGFSYHEIATILGTPEDSLKLARRLAFESLEELLWRGTA